MHKNTYGEIILDSQDLCDLVMQGRSVTDMDGVTVSADFDLENLINSVEDPGRLLTWTFPEASDISVPEFDAKRQAHWFMPQQYRDMDIAQHVLDLCQDQAQLQRAGEELLLYQERGLLDLLRYLRYLVDVMTEHRVIWGVGRGSSVSSYVLYLLGVHRIDSMFYDLDVREFLR
jgi:DNA polymerase III alpha subunit